MDAGAAEARVNPELPARPGIRNEKCAANAADMLAWWRQLFGQVGTGTQGERLAADFLRREKGMAIVARNWRSPRDRRDELDLVCRDGEVLVFVEVKTRAAAALVQGYDAIDERKRRVVRRAAEAYLGGLRPADRPRTLRFDAVEVAMPPAGDRRAPEVRHFENAPLFAKHFRAAD
jgi:putative endonuclease